MEMIFYSHANKTHFHKKSCALGLTLKVRVFETRKWPVVLNSTNSDITFCFVLCLQGELTLFNLPMYLNYQRPLLIVFRADSEDTSITPVITKIARDNSLPSVFLCWMPV